MRFNKDYEEFLNHLKESNQKAQIKTELSNCERTAISLFVAYLNIRYKSKPYNKSLELTGKSRVDSHGTEFNEDWDKL